jgi:hypothetical protein
MLGLGLSIPDTARARGGDYDPATAALIARMALPPGGYRAGQIDATVRAIKAAGVWSKLDLLYLIAAHDAQAARLNWVADAYNLSAVNAPAFTVDRGYAGDGTTSYLDTGWAPAGSARFLSSDASMGCWLNAGTDIASSSAVAMGTTDGSSALGSFVSPRGGTGFVRGRMNQVGTADANVAVTSRLGLTVLSRTAPNLVTAYRGNAAAGSFANAATTRPTATLFLGGSNQGGLMFAVNNRFAAAFAGAGLSGGEVAALHGALNGYLSAIGGA